MPIQVAVPVKCLVGIAFVAACSFSQSQGTGKLISKEPLDQIADFAERICPPVKDSGTTSSVEISGQAKAELSKLLKKLADLGVSGAAKYKSSEYEGVLREQLASLLKSNQDCRLAVFRELSSRLLPTPKPQTDRAVFVPPPLTQLPPKTCTPRWSECTGYNNLIGLWRGRIPKGPMMTVLVEPQQGENVLASFVINEQRCQASLALRYVNDTMLSTAEFFFKPIATTSGCPEIESISLTPLDSTAWFKLTKPGGDQIVITANKPV
jgi:hypothetical protein